MLYYITFIWYDMICCVMLRYAVHCNTVPCYVVTSLSLSFNLSVCLIAGDLSRSIRSGLVTSYSSGRLTFLCV